MKKIKENTNKHKAKPFLKWAGGKSQLLNIIKTLYPDSLINHQCHYYFEPFIGAGAVFFDIIQNYSLKYAYLSDINPEIIIAYKVIQKNVKSLIENLADLSIQYQSLTDNQQKTFYYKIRDDYNQQRIDFNYDDFSEVWIKRSAMLIFLNKTCFNGLFRTNKKGDFNVPQGKYKQPKIIDEENLTLIANLLQNTDIQLADFSESINHIKDNSFIYLDPPYRPLNKTSYFTSYSKFVFDDTQQKRLADFYKQLNHDYQVYLMLSNSDPKNENPDDNFFDELYQDFKIYRVSASRMINSKATKRGNVKELIITNY